ncbi:MAG: 2,3-bisphosphoglycerate-independent phosphoglycerate mutase [Flavobacteriales bacterium]|jgi:2,3-bisphosphoglycerate-independent phosphoglycerate mutase|nr:2,3-bisphosphoglycerate-independent phosphoglycerate mutase [Flavobacteriales bacterium]MBK7288208.1 2,3-bisphosphoglycerate-independent phosphoglycerate mutase [Flavobacteriales bacterium]MBK9058845.1 2,3-bisphosphoglycerate-independent phosphoglycerate mutase [Flavobacteriales bacterium]QQS71167.1 MAG: 2,3-bisphosphoglycerate-independent phosphoglycerate mutase [Flavobacteriales bacterium]HQV38700.1 2,3-bisphosphoglycerate-independent phosphoglycerate mutase [Flavobacteriales bacterium]
MTESKAALIILDGWGIGAGDGTDAIAQADTPFIDSLFRTAPHARLRTDGEHVGLPPGQMGNSEVGHLNIGAGRVVYQDLVRIDLSIADGSLGKNAVLQEAFTAASAPGRRLHLLGLVGNGGVHASSAHLVALCKLAATAGLKDIFIHAITDGRDTDPRSGLGFIQQLEQDIAGTPARIASICGRYYAMDRDKRWERIKKAYDLLVQGRGDRAPSASWAIEASYAKGITDEFIEPCAIVGTDQRPLTHIHPDDVVICFNFRTDRCREITEALTQQAFPEQDMSPLPLHYVTMTQYDHRFKGVKVLFRKDDLAMTLGEVVSKAGGAQVRLAETEKYPHVTFFFSGGREQPFIGERRTVVPSPKVATYDLQPEMSAEGVTQAAVAEVKAGDARLMVLNFANPDMVGHTGVFPAIVKAVETADSCTQRVVEAGRAKGWSFVIIADHGNADKAVNPDGSPNTAHTLNPVPVFVLTDRTVQVHDGILADVAPTLLDLMEIEQPKEMTGRSLIG